MIESRIQLLAVAAVQSVADVIVSRDAIDAERRLTGVAVVGFMEALLMVQERRWLHEEHRKGSHADVVEAVTGIAAVARIRHLSEALAQLLDEDVDRRFHGQYLYQKWLKSTSAILSMTYDSVRQSIQNWEPKIRIADFGQPVRCLLRIGI